MCGGPLAPLLLKCMKAHAAAPVVQEAACGALSNLALNGENKGRIGKEGGVELIIEAPRGSVKAGGCPECSGGGFSLGHKENLYKSSFSLYKEASLE